MIDFGPLLSNPESDVPLWCSIPVRHLFTIFMGITSSAFDINDAPSIRNHRAAGWSDFDPGRYLRVVEVKLHRSLICGSGDIPIWHFKPSSADGDHKAVTNKERTHDPYAV